MPADFFSIWNIISWILTTPPRQEPCYRKFHPGSPLQLRLFEVLLQERQRHWVHLRLVVTFPKTISRNGNLLKYSNNSWYSKELVCNIRMAGFEFRKNALPNKTSGILKSSLCTLGSTPPPPANFFVPTLWGGPMLAQETTAGCNRLCSYIRIFGLARPSSVLPYLSKNWKDIHVVLMHKLKQSAKCLTISLKNSNKKLLFKIFTSTGAMY